MLLPNQHANAGDLLHTQQKHARKAMAAVARIVSEER